ncbi:MAG: ribonuclease Y [Oscillospiraceae bacterium]|jgi:ribonuclease Y|nr:ribonuclease Y [Oscillospiraceae bacterium]
MYLLTAPADSAGFPIYQIVLNLLLFAIGAGISGIFFYQFGQKARAKFSERHLKSAEERAAEILDKADMQRNEILRDAHAEGKKLSSEYLAREEEYIKRKDTELSKKEKDFSEELKLRRAELTNGEHRITQKEQVLDKKSEKAEEHQKRLDKKAEELKALEAEIESMKASELEKLERVAALSREDAKAELLSLLDGELETEKARRIYYANEQCKAECDLSAQYLLADAMAMTASETVSELGATIVQISEDQKGALIGREGRNIRAIENAVGAAVIIEDTPCIAMISTHDLRRREIGKRLIETLVREGGIQPAKIEETHKIIEANVSALMKKKAAEAALKCKISGVNSALMEYMGKLYFRTSYGQNVLDHSIEVANLCASLAGELGANAIVARRAGFLHDIGKAIEGTEGSHAANGAELCERYRESAEVVHAIAAHHKDLEAAGVIDLIVRIADALSAGRPGARNMTADDYIRRISELENLCGTFDGVEKAYAFQSGHEVRIVVNPLRISDSAMTLLARDIANKIYSDLRYPGQIKVNVIRETRAESVAK